MSRDMPTGTALMAVNKAIETVTAATNMATPARSTAETTRTMRTMRVTAHAILITPGTITPDTITPDTITPDTITPDTTPVPIRANAISAITAVMARGEVPNTRIIPRATMRLLTISTGVRRTMAITKQARVNITLERHIMPVEDTTARNTALARHIGMVRSSTLTGIITTPRCTPQPPGIAEAAITSTVALIMATSTTPKERASTTPVILATLTDDMTTINRVQAGLFTGRGTWRADCLAGSPTVSEGNPLQTLAYASGFHGRMNNPS